MSKEKRTRKKDNSNRLGYAINQGLEGAGVGASLGYMGGVYKHINDYSKDPNKPNRSIIDKAKDAVWKLRKRFSKKGSKGDILNQARDIVKEHSKKPKFNYNAKPLRKGLDQEINSLIKSGAKGALIGGALVGVPTAYLAYKGYKKGNKKRRRYEEELIDMISFGENIINRIVM